MALSKLRTTRTGLYEPLADINVTPLVDVMLVLLVVFMITAPMMAAGMKVNLPKAASAQPLRAHQPVVVTLAPQGVIDVDGSAVTADRLVETIKAKLAGSDDDVIHLRADTNVLYGDVMGVLDALAAQGLTKIAMRSAGRPGSKEQAGRNAVAALPAPASSSPQSTP